jgi:hypothetical protein
MLSKQTPPTEKNINNLEGITLYKTQVLFQQDSPQVE